MKKVLIVLIVLISFGVIAFGIYFASTYEFENKQNHEKENIELNNNEINLIKNDDIKLESILETESGIVETYKITINGLEKELSLTFTKEIDEENKVWSIKANYKDNLVYYYMESFIDEENIETYNKNMIKNSFNESNFKFIKGKDDKNYLIIISNIGNNLAGREEKMYILNQDLEFVNNDLLDYAGNSNTYGMSIMSTYTSYKLGEVTYPWYTDVFKICNNMSDCYINVKLENNKIYYLVPDKNYENLEERVYTLNNNKLSYEIINTYKIYDIYGQVE